MVEDKIALLVVFGGISPEHEISCRSAASILRAIDMEKYTVYKMGLTKEGQWLLTDASPEKIESGQWTKGLSSKKAMISSDRTVHGIVLGQGKEIRIDCVFPVIHGVTGEDGSLQGLLQLSGLPYVGPGVSASACAMDKGLTKAVVSGNGVKQAPNCETNRYSFASNPMEELKRVIDTFGGAYPLFVKPACTGSSVGISKVTTDRELFDGIKLAMELDHKVIIEKEIRGRELEVAVLGNRDPQASPIGEIKAAAEFYDYDAKYKSDIIQTSIVTDLPEEKQQEVKNAAVTVYKALGCRGLSRVDFFLSEDDEVIFNEINTMPGFTSISMYPILWQAAGLEYSELIDRLVDLAIEEAEEF